MDVVQQKVAGAMLAAKVRLKAVQKVPQKVVLSEALHLPAKAPKLLLKKAVLLIKVVAAVAPAKELPKKVLQRALARVEQKVPLRKVGQPAKAHPAKHLLKVAAIRVVAGAVNPLFP